MDVNKAGFKLVRNLKILNVLRMEMQSTCLLELPDIQCVLVSNTGYKHNFCLFTGKRHRAPLIS